MAKDKADSKTIDLVSGKAIKGKTAAERREYLRIKKRESRLRARKAAHTHAGMHDPDLPDQVTLTLSRGAKGLLELMARDAEQSMSAFVDAMIKAHPKARTVKKRLPGLFG